MNRLDLTPVFRTAVGFDRMANLVDSMIAGGIDNQSNWPPYNIEKQGDGVKVTAPQQWDQPAKEFSGDMDTLTGEVTEYVGVIVSADEEKQVLLQASGLVKHRDISKVAQAVGKVGTESSKSLYVAVKQVGQ